MLPMEKYQRFCVEGTLGTGDASKTLVAAVAGVQIVVTSLSLVSLVAAAQTVYVGDTSGTVKAASNPVSLVVGASRVLQLQQGLPLTIGEALIIKPAAAGPSIHVVVEGYLLKS